MEDWFSPCERVQSRSASCNVRDGCRYSVCVVAWEGGVGSIFHYEGTKRPKLAIQSDRSWFGGFSEGSRRLRLIMARGGAHSGVPLKPLETFRGGDRCWFWLNGDRGNQPCPKGSMELGRDSRAASGRLCTGLPMLIGGVKCSLGIAT